MSLTILIGLPGSGKSYTIAQQRFDQVYDDFISDFYNGHVIDALQKGRKISVADPRLCDFTIFSRYLNIFEQFIDPSHIRLILFENNPQQCLINIQLRNDSRRNVERTLHLYSSFYHLDNYIKLDYPFTILPVWTPSNV